MNRSTYKTLNDCLTKSTTLAIEETLVDAIDWHRRRMQ